MTIEITELPRIIETLAIGSAPEFVVLDYAEFVAFVASASPANAPHVVATLDHGTEHAFVVLTMASFSNYVSTLNVVGEVNEQHYLAKHPDVKAAVESGHLPSGTHHYVIAGYFERRAVKWRDATRPQDGKPPLPLPADAPASASFPDIP